MSYPYPPLYADPFGNPQPPQGSYPDASMMQDQQMPIDGQMSNDEMSQIAAMQQDDGGMPGYRDGGSVKDKTNVKSLAQMIRSKGEGSDKILAHLNSKEAQLLAEHFGVDINPETGLPQFDFWSRLKKKFKKVLGPVGGAILGNMIMPGIGGLIGGGIGGSFGHPNDRAGPLAGAGMGQLGLAGMGGLGSLANSAGFTGLGGGLQSLAGPNYISSLISGVSPGAGTMFGAPAQLPGFLQGAGNIWGSQAPQQMAGIATAPIAGAVNAPAVASSPWALSNLLTPANVLAGGSLATNLLTRVSPEDQAMAQAKSQLYLEDEMEKRRKKKRDEMRNEFSFQVPEYIVSKFSKGGSTDLESILGSLENEEAEDNDGFNEEDLGFYVDGDTGGEDDKIFAKLSDGEFVIRAKVVSALGDGNNKAGAKKLMKMCKEIMRKHGIQENGPKEHENPLVYMMAAA